MDLGDVLQANSLMRLGTQDEQLTIYCERVKWLPDWATHSEILELAEGLPYKIPAWLTSIPVGCVAGPAVKILQFFTPFLFGFVFLFAMLAVYVIKCPAQGFPEYPLWLVTCVFLPFLVVAMVVEWICFRYQAYSKVQVIGPFKFAGFKMDFIPLMLLVGGISALSHSDMMTNGLFMATTWHMGDSSCVEAGNLYPEKVEEIWAFVMEHSTLKNTMLSKVNFSSLTFLAWLLMFLQVIPAVTGGIPRCGESDITYAVYMKDAEDTSPTKIEYQTTLDRKANHGSVLAILAETSRMTSITFNSLSYAQGKAESFLLEEARMGKKGETRCLLDTMHYVKDLLRESVQRLFVVGVLENAIQMNLQTSLMAINQVLGQRQHQVVASILLGFLMSLKKVFDSTTVFVFARDMVRRIRYFSPGMTEEEERDLCLIWKLIVVNIFFLFMYLLLTFYAMAKFIMAFVCEDSMWNINGCVSLPDRLKHAAGIPS